jgi:hypothetical protein
LAQHVEVAPPVKYPDGAWASCVRVWTDVVEGATDPELVAPIISSANQMQTMSALVYDPDTSSISEAFTSVVFDDTVDSWARVMILAAAMQSGAAHSRAHGLAEAVGGTVAATVHPSSGERAEMDDLLNLPARVATDGATGSSAFAGELMLKLAETGSEMWPCSGDGEGFTAEVEYASDVPVAAEIEQRGDLMARTGLVQVWADQPHPEYGHGALIALRLPVSLDPNVTAQAANELNRMETSGAGPTTMMGAWCEDPASEGSLVFVTFVPSALAMSGVLENLVTYDAVRSGWVHAVSS